MARISIEQARGWAQEEEDGKLPLAQLDTALLTQVEDSVIAQLSVGSYDVAGWTTDANTPSLVQSVIAMLYVAWLYDRAYSEDAGETDSYATLLRATAAANIAGILDGTFPLIGEVITNTSSDSPSFYPNDMSSAACPTSDDPSLGGPAFSMGARF